MSGYMHIVDDTTEEDKVNIHTICGLQAILRPNYDRWRFLSGLGGWFFSDYNWCPKCSEHPTMQMMLLKDIEL